MKLAHIGQRVAQDLYHRPISPHVSQSSIIRDACDTASHGELSTSMLDRLCDMVERRLKDPYKYNLK